MLNKLINLLFFNYRLFLILFAMINFSNAQVKTDFQLAEHGTVPCVRFDQQKRIHLAWHENGEAVYYRMFDTLGNSLSNRLDFPQTSSSQTTRFAIRNDSLVIVWRDILVTFNSHIQGQLLPLGADSVSQNFQFSDTVFFDSERISPDVCFLNDSIFIVVWCGLGIDFPEVDEAVYGQLMNTSLEFIGNNFVLAGTSDMQVIFKKVRVLSSGNSDNFLIIWIDDHSGSNIIYGRLFTGEGIPLDSMFIISEDPEIENIWFIDAAMDESGNFVVAWGALKNSIWTIQFRKYNENGSTLSEIINATSVEDSVLSYASVAVSMDFDGKGLVVWEQYLNNRSRIFGRRFNEDSSFLGNSFLLSNAEDGLNHYWPDADVKDDKMLIAWNRGSGGIWGSYSEFYDPNDITPPDNNNYIKSFNLFQNFPNPFNNTTIIRYKIAHPEYTNVVVNNHLGQRIRTLTSSYQTPGDYYVKWDGKNEKGLVMPSGLYILTLYSG